MQRVVDHSIYYRLVSLWILCEAMLGGIIHGFRIPVSGLIVGSSAVVCIGLIAWYVPAKGMILKATLIVAIFKMMLSPQAPLPAYIAVFFQGLLGELLFWNRRYFKGACILFGTLALFESGLQRILLLTIIYGNDLWVVINQFFNGLTKQQTTTNYSLIIGGGYVAIHLLTGIIIGVMAGKLPGRIEKWKREGNKELVVPGEYSSKQLLPSRRKKKRRYLLLLIWILLVAVYLQSEFNIGTPLLPSYISLRILIRSLIIVFAWIFIIGPGLTRLLHHWLNSKRSASAKEITEILTLLPRMQSIVRECWEHSVDMRGWQRWKRFTKLVLVNTFHAADNKQTFILTGPIRSGKTTSLLKWARLGSGVHGILTPDLDGKRVFLDITTGESFPMEASAPDTNIVNIGRFSFSKSSFEKASQTIEYSIASEGWLVIDEIGPLELREEGFAAALRKLLETRTGRTLLVVREGLVNQVESFFGINATVITRLEELPE